jgi:PKD repeat protein
MPSPLGWLIALLILLVIVACILWWWRYYAGGVPSGCRHDLTLRNLSPAGPHQIRVSAYTPGTRITGASAPAGWLQTPAYPASVNWRPAAGGPVPQGDPLPGPFSIWDESNAQPHKQVSVDWLAQDGTLICRQLLRVTCGEAADPDGAVSVPEHSAGCGCLSAETEADPDASQLADPDLEVQLAPAFQSGFLEVTVPYTVIAEPPQLAFTRLWEVTLQDALGDEQLIPAVVSDDMAGHAVFTLPGSGDYMFYLTVTDPTNCVTATDSEDDVVEDTDAVAFRMESEETEIEVTAPDPCDPLTYEGKDVTLPTGANPNWTVTNLATKAVIPLTPFGGVVTYTCPTPNISYRFRLEADDPVSGQSRMAVALIVTPTAPPLSADFGWKYDSCPFDHFAVGFQNLSTTCEAEWDWDFGDGSPHGTLYVPTHTYVAAGTYTVTLTMTATPLGTTTPQVVTVKHDVTVQHWTPDISYTVCSDGRVIYRTSAPEGGRHTPYWRTWTFPGGSVSRKKHLHAAEVRVCYDTPGPRRALLFAENPGGGHCTGTIELDVPSIVHCCLHDRVTGVGEFNYNQNSYQLHMLLRFHGSPHGVIFAKSKLFKLVDGEWKRRRAHHIEVTFKGDVITRSKTGCFCGKTYWVDRNRSRAKRSRVAKRHLPLLAEPIRVLKDGITSTHLVQVDAKDVGNREFTLSLWVKDCGCK